MRRTSSDIGVILLLAGILTIGCVAGATASEMRGVASVFLVDLACFVAIGWAAFKGSRAVVFLLFNVTYFVFLMGGVTVSMLQGATFESFFSSTPASGAEACYLAMLSLCIIDFVYVTFMTSSGRKKQKKSARFGQKEKSEIKPTGFLRGFVLVVLIVSGLVKLYMSYEAMGHSQANGYLSLYQDYSSSLPQVAQYLASVFYLSLFLYLASYPSKRGTIFALSLTAIIELLVVVAGDRGEAMCALVTLLVYLIWRSKKGFGGLRWTKAKTVVLVILSPVVLALLQSVKYTRMGNDFDMPIYDAVVDFFCFPRRIA